VSSLAFLKKLGYFPYAFVSLGIAASLYAQKAAGRWGDILVWLSGACLTTGLLWALVKICSGLFAKRPARGLIDGLVAGAIAGFVAGRLGYGSHRMEDIQRFIYVDLYGNGELSPIVSSYGEPGYIRTFLVFTFTLPVAGILGLGCDLIHADRKINWRRDVGIVLLVAVVLLLFVGFGIFRYVPEMQGRGINFSELLLIFEVFLLAFSMLMAFSFRWSARKFLGRFSIIAGWIFAMRMITFFLHSTVNDRGPLWDRHYVHDVSGRDEYAMAATAVLLCIWTVIVYASFYVDYPLTRWLDERTQSKGKHK